MITIPRTKVYFPFSSLKKGLKVIFSGNILEGKHIKGFEDAFREYIGVEHAISVSCGKMGLYLSLMALGAKEDDEIILPSYTVWDVPAVVIASGLRPVFIDINSEDYNINIKLVREAVTKKTKFILATHMYGYPCDMDSVLEIAREYNLYVIEDCAQSLGAEYKNRKVGSIGEVGYFSFGMLKNFNTLGGGMVVSNDALIAERIKKELAAFTFPKIQILIRRLVSASLLSLCTCHSFFSFLVFPLLFIARPSTVNKILTHFLDNEPPDKISQGFIKKYSFNFSNLQARIGLDQLKTLEKLNTKRAKNAQILSSILNGVENISVPRTLPFSQPNYLNYVIRVPSDKREKIIKKMFMKGIDLGYGFLSDCSGMKQFERFKTNCPVSSAIAKTNLYIPIQPPLEEIHMEYIARNIKEILSKLSEDGTGYL